MSRSSPSNFTAPKDDRLLAYLAGLVDGDGTISFTHDDQSIGGIRIRIAVAVTDHALVEWLRATFGGSVGVDRPKDADGRSGIYGRLPMHVWRLDGIESVYECAKALRPFLRIKKANAERVMLLASAVILERRARPLRDLRAGFCLKSGEEGRVRKAVTIRVMGRERGSPGPPGGRVWRDAC